LKSGNRVYGVEPNSGIAPGRRGIFASYDGFLSIEGSAESTTLGDSSVDFVAAGQAFHWFEPEKTRAEFRRILRPQGWVVAIWNFREMETPFATAYEDLLVKYGTDYTRVRDSYLRPTTFKDFSSGNNSCITPCPMCGSWIGTGSQGCYAAARMFRGKAMRISPR